MSKLTSLLQEITKENFRRLSEILHYHREEAMATENGEDWCGLIKLASMAGISPEKISLGANVPIAYVIQWKEGTAFKRRLYQGHVVKFLESECLKGFVRA